MTDGANGRPVLILLDEVLKYMERAAAVAVQDSTLQRQTKDFFQNLTVEVANSRNAVLVYSLTSFAREAFGNISLLEELDKLAARVDQLRAPFPSMFRTSDNQANSLCGIFRKTSAERSGTAEFPLIFTSIRRLLHELAKLS